MVKSKRPSVRLGAVNEQRNKVRGIVGSLRGQSVGTSTIEKYHSSIRDTLLKARTDLPPDQYDFFIHWTDRQTKTQVPARFRQPRVGYSYLNRIARSKALSLDRELAWASALLATATVEITQFRQLADDLERAFWTGKSQHFIRSYRAIARQFGPSLWLVEVSIAVRQITKGLESQKRYVARLKRLIPKGILPFFAHYVSVRNEPSVTPLRFAEDMASRLAEGVDDKKIRNFLYYKLTQQLPESATSISSILQTTQNLSLVDRYESFIAIVQHLVKGPLSDRLASELKASVAKLDAIDDWRLDKIALCIGLSRKNGRTPGKIFKSADALAAENYRKAYRLAFAEFQTSPPFLPSLLVAAVSGGSCRTKSRLRETHPFIYLVDRLAAIFNRSRDLNRAVNDVTKASRNFRFLGLAGALEDVCWSQARTRSNFSFSALKQVTLSYQGTCALDILSSSESHAKALVDEIKENAGYGIVNVLSLIRFKQHEHRSISTPFERYARAEYFFLNSFPREASDCLGASVGESSLPINLASRRLKIEALTRIPDRRNAMRLIASSIASFPGAEDMYPIEEALTPNWDALRPLADDLSLSILLHVLWKKKSNSRLATLRRFSFEEFLERHHLTRPSELENISDRFETRELVYFLRYVCVTEVMDMTPVFETSREIEEERRQLCGILVELDPQNAAEYRGEIFEITHRIAIQDGMRIVDSSRLYVDVDGISRWAAKEVSEDFGRYNELRAAGIGISEGLMEVFKRVSAHSAGKFVTFEFPMNEADDLLFAMIEKIKIQFLTNASYGLDSYLSKRIRHGSIPNYLRGPVEKSELITGKDATTGRYKLNDFWINRLSAIMNGNEYAVQSAFAEFAEGFDRIVLHLKDELLHVRDANHKQGQFDIPLSIPVVAILREYAQQSDLPEFLRFCYSIFWTLLEISLQNVQSFLKTETKDEVVAAFDTFRARLYKLGVASAELSVAIGDTCTEVQRQIDVVADWFKKSESVTALHSFSIKQAIEIAIASALNGMRAFKPNIANDVVDGKLVGVRGLMMIEDVIGIALDNAYKHSGITRGGNIRIEGQFDAAREMVCIVVSSDVSVSSMEVESTLEAIRDSIRKGSFKDQVRQEGGSGFLKIAGALSESGGSISFGFKEPKEFFLEVEFNLGAVEASDEGSED